MLAHSLMATLLRIGHELSTGPDMTAASPDQLTIMGPAIFLARLSKQPWVHPELRMQFSDNAINSLRMEKTIGDERSEYSTLFYGPPGFLWSALIVACDLEWPFPEILSKIGISPVELNTFHKGLLQSILNKDWEGKHELIMGLTGIGLYSLVMLEVIDQPIHRQIVKAILGQLELCKKSPNPEEYTWLSKPIGPNAWSSGIEQQVDHFNLGLSHGVPGPLVFLARCLEAGIERSRAQKLLKGALRWLESVPSPRDSSQSRYPAKWIPGFPSQPSQLAWCYGDPGVAASILISARALKDSRLFLQALEIFEHRIQTSQNSGRGFDFRDCCLCHGWAGMEFLSLWFARVGGKDKLRKNAQVFLDSILARQTPSHSSFGVFPSVQGYFPKEHCKRDDSFLTGSSGVGLCLLSGLNPERPTVWAGMLGLIE